MNSVSVIIPNYNRSGLVNQTVRNVLDQSLTPEQVIVVDDGSTDDSVESLRDEFGSQIELIQQTNQGPGAARNAGLDRATGEFIWLMDSDDLASLNKLETQVSALEDQEADVVYSPCARVYFRDGSIEVDGPVLQQKALPKSRNAMTWFLTDWSLVLQQCLIRKEILTKIGFYRTDLWTCDDSELFARILANCAKLVFNHESITLYRENDHGKVTKSGFQNNRRILDWAKCLIYMHHHCENHPFIRDHPDFQARLWRSLVEMSAFCSEEHETINQLSAIITRSDFILKIDSLNRRIRKAVRTRVEKTHWSVAYQVGEMTDSQKQLIRQLGFSVTRRNT